MKNGNDKNNSTFQIGLVQALSYRIQRNFVMQNLALSMCLRKKKGKGNEQKGNKATHSAT